MKAAAEVVPTPSTDTLRKLLTPFVDSAARQDALNAEGVSAPEVQVVDLLGQKLLDQLSTFVELLLRWNSRTNLTAIRNPEEIVRRHLGESLFLAVQLRPLLATEATVLDFGSGAGFPGLPLQMLYPELRVTLAESQGKKASFLREAVRTLGLQTEVWSDRVERMPVPRTFDAVVMRAVDNPAQALEVAQQRLSPAAWMGVLVGESTFIEGAGSKRVTLPESHSRFLELWQSYVPRGT